MKYKYQRTYNKGAYRSANSKKKVYHYCGDRARGYRMMKWRELLYELGIPAEYRKSWVNNLLNEQ